MMSGSLYANLIIKGLIGFLGFVDVYYHALLIFMKEILSKLFVVFKMLLLYNLFYSAPKTRKSQIT